MDKIKSKNKNKDGAKGTSNFYSFGREQSTSNPQFKNSFLWLLFFSSPQSLNSKRDKLEIFGTCIFKNTIEHTLRSRHWTEL